MRAVRFLAPVIGVALVVLYALTRVLFAVFRPGKAIISRAVGTGIRRRGTFAPLMYPTNGASIGIGRASIKKRLRLAEGNTNWTIGLPRSDRHCCRPCAVFPAFKRPQCRQPGNGTTRTAGRIQLPVPDAVEVGHGN